VRGPIPRQRVGRRRLGVEKKMEEEGDCSAL